MKKSSYIFAVIMLSITHLAWAGDDIKLSAKQIQALGKFPTPTGCLANFPPPPESCDDRNPALCCASMPVATYSNELRDKLHGQYYTKK